MSRSPRPTQYWSLSDQDLVCRCARSRDDEAWREFGCRFERPISLTVIRTASLWGGATRRDIEDLVQETYLKLWQDRCRHLRDFAIRHPTAILGYVKTIAANVTHDYFKSRRSEKGGGNKPHVSTSDVDPEAGNDVHGSEGRIAFEIVLKEVDEYLSSSTGPDAERDRMIFWLYFRQGMSTREMASLPTIGLKAKGVGAVIERLKHCVREQILQSVRIKAMAGGK